MAEPERVLRGARAWLYAQGGNRIVPDIGRRLAELADLTCAIWRQPDSGIWEVRSEPVHLAQSKMMCGSRSTGPWSRSASLVAACRG